MFDGDQSNSAGRRERLMRKQEQKSAFTDKVGGDNKGGAKMCATPSSISGNVFNSVSGHASGMDSVRSATPSSRIGGSSVATALPTDNSANFKQRINVGRHSYDIVIDCRYPLADMSMNHKRRTITWVAQVNGEEDAYSVQIPKAYDLEASTFVKEDFPNGHCTISVPVLNRNVFS